MLSTMYDPIGCSIQSNEMRIIAIDSGGESCPVSPLTMTEPIGRPSFGAEQVTDSAIVDNVPATSTSMGVSTPGISKSRTGRAASSMRVWDYEEDQLLLMPSTRWVSDGVRLLGSSLIDQRPCAAIGSLAFSHHNARK